MVIFASLILSMYITIVLIPIFSRIAHKYNALDVPDERKIHSIPKPRVGGIAMALGVFPPIFLWVPSTPFFKSLLIGTGIIVTFGIIDDFKGLNFKTKFLAQFVASLIVVLYGGVQIKYFGTLLPAGFFLPEWFSTALSVIVIIGVTNAINLSDGLDGLAGGVTLLSFICLGYLAFCFENTTIFLFSVSVIGAIFGFLRYNSYPAVLFMGDTGSQLLGFLAITLSLSLTQSNTPLSPLLPLLILGFPILDTLSVMMSRIVAGESPFKADKRHFHHRLIDIGLYHSEAVLTIYFLQSFFVLIAFLFRFSSEWSLLSFYLVFSCIILIFFFIAYKKGWELNRYEKFDTIVKGHLRIIKDKNLLIKFSFGFVRLVFSGLLIFSCFVPESIPSYYSTLSVLLLAVFLITWKINSAWLISLSAIIFYLLIPMLIYFGEANAVQWATRTVMDFQMFLFGSLLVFVYLTLKFTRRRDGFKTTPLDFLILFAVLVIPNLPDENIQGLDFGVSAIKIIILYLGFEVLTGELRNKTYHIGILATIVLSILSVRGLLG